MKLHPFHKVTAQAQEAMAMGATIYQQFNCANCGTKQTIETPNVFHKTGRCEECSHITDIEHDGCNFLAHFGAQPR